MIIGMLGRIALVIADGPSEGMETYRSRATFCVDQAARRPLARSIVRDRGGAFKLVAALPEIPGVRHATIPTATYHGVCYDVANPVAIEFTTNDPTIEDEVSAA